jgi:WD40 repeat protein
MPVAPPTARRPEKSGRRFRVGVKRRPLAGHTGYVVSAAYSPDGHGLACGSGDGAVTIWKRSPAEN